MKEWNRVKLEDLENLGQELRNLVKKPALILLTGEVGAGKTTFVKAFAHDCKISSPTYSLISEYDDLVHADFYRIKNVRELEHLELELYLDGKSFFFVEWGKEYSIELKKLVGSEFNYYEITFEMGSKPNERKIRLL